MDRFVIPVIIVLALAGIAWKFQEDRIRDWLGWERVEEESKPTPTDPFGPRTPRDTPPAPEPGHEPANEVDLTAEEAIERIVTCRYPDPELPPVENFLGQGDASGIPPAIFPLPVRVQRQVSLTETTPDGIVARAVVIPGGAVQATSLENGELFVHSLARDAITARVPLSEVALEEALSERRSHLLERARTRVEAARQADRMLLRKNYLAINRLRETGSCWDDPDDDRFAPIQASISAGQAGAVELADLVGYCWNGRETVRSGPFQGNYTTVTVGFSADTGGLGPVSWRSICIVLDGTVQGWLTRVPAREE